MTKIKVRKDHDEWDEREVDSDRLDRNPDEASENPSDGGGDMPDVSEMDGDGTESDGEGPEGDADGDGPSQDDLPPVRWHCNGWAWPHYGPESRVAEQYANQRAIARLINTNPRLQHEGRLPEFAKLDEIQAAAQDFKACVEAREVTVPELREELAAKDKALGIANEMARLANNSASRKDRLLEKLVGVLDAMAEEADADYLAGWVDKIMAEINPEG